MLHELYWFHEFITISCISITCLNSTPQYKINVPIVTTIFITVSTIYHRSPSPWDNLWQSALLHHNGNILLLTSLEVSLWLHSPLGSSASFLGNRWSSALTPCTWNRWYDSGPSWNPIYFSSWIFLFQSGLLFSVGHTLLPLSGILPDSQTILGDVSFFSTWIAWLGVGFNWVLFGCVLHLFLHHRFF